MNQLTDWLKSWGSGGGLQDGPGNDERMAFERGMLEQQARLDRLQRAKRLRELRGGRAR